MSVPVYILAGGRSSRFGCDKARAAVDGQPLLARLAERIAPAAARITVIADTPGKYADLGLRTLADLHPGGGPMSGLQAALHDSTQPWLLLLSCDLVLVRPAWIERLLAARAEQAMIVAFRHELWEPLIALYHRRLLPEVDRRLRDGRRRMQSLLHDCGAIAIPIPEDWPAMNQANTPAELAAALAQGETR
jgi:molybdopterin-guanine dinucleotide biosynthesis protein A